jgi:hypothetical protein
MKSLKYYVLYFRTLFYIFTTLPCCYLDLLTLKVTFLSTLCFMRWKILEQTMYVIHVS